MTESTPLVLVIDCVRSAHNVGAMFRTADAAGVREVILVGYTPAPFDRFGRPVPALQKAALGAEQSVPYRTVATLTDAIVDLRASGHTLVAVEQAPQAMSLFTYEPALEPLALVVGNEVDGLDAAALALVETVVEIPMAGTKESLNVATSAGIVLYTIRRAWSRLAG